MDNIKNFEDFLDRMQGLLDNAKKQGHIIVRIEDLENAFPEHKESKESEDERIKKAISQCVEDMRGQFEKLYKVHHKDAIAWLEKQGEHINFLSKIQVGDKVTRNKDGVLVNLSQLNRVAKPAEKQCKKLAEKYNITGIKSKHAEGKLGEMIKKMKSTDKVEPKFHKSDWITNGDYTWKIVEVKPLDYILQSQDGNIVDDTISHVDEQFHSFNIEDAKDGDVLTSKDGNDILIFRNVEDDVSFSSYYNIRGREEICWTNRNFIPATKEQRDALMKSMADAGYTFDFEKKELKKIEQKPIEWHREDEQNLNACLGYIPDEFLRKWLTDIIHVKYDNPAWSEEDKQLIEEAAECLRKYAKQVQGGYSKVYVDSLADRIESLKPQNTWKPTEEQIRRLEYFVKLWGKTEDTENTKVFETVKSLLNDLKQL